MTHPETMYSHDLANNCIILKWGEAGYYKTDYPEGGYTDEIIDEMNSVLFDGDIEKAKIARMAMEICSVVNPADWEKNFDMIVERKGR